VASLSQTSWGWTAGAGIEARVYDNWTIKGEYLYLDLGSVTAQAPLLGGGATTSFTVTSDIRSHVFRIGLNYWLDPMTAAGLLN
jgi:outer membrane immunogenic protein